MSDGESVAMSSSSSISGDHTHKAEESNSTAADEGHMVQFNLTDPEDVELKLDNLTDEEMEQLLKQAYRINNQLRNELDRKQREEATHGSTRLSSQSATTKSKEDVQLPPLKNARERRGFTPLGPKTHTQQLYSSPVSSSRLKARTAVKQPTKPKPEWNDRFNL